MRHGKKFNHLSRKAGHRKAMLRNMASSLIEHKRIKTTLAKAKALRKYIEPLCTRAKVNTTHSRRVAYRYLQNKEAIKELFEVIGPKIMERPGGYVRVLKMGFRPSDAAEVALIEFVDFNEDAIRSEEEQADKKRTRRGRRRKKKSNSNEEASVENEVSEEVEEEEETEEETPEVEETVEEEETPEVEEEEEDDEEEK